jgi:hypothetical protein
MDAQQNPFRTGGIKMKALLLGAGASYECGMPLVWEFTGVLRANVLKRLDSHLFDFRKDPSFRAIFESILCSPALHYEQMVAELEALHLKRDVHSATAYNALRQLIDCVQILLLEDQLNTTPMLAEKAKDYAGIKSLLAQQPCLNVFSLNHDLNIEEICKFQGVPCRDGFFEDAADRYAHIAHFKTLTREQMDAGNLNFFAPDDLGVNLIKLHGSLDVFAVEDKNLFLKCAPLTHEPLGAYLREVMRVEAHSIQVCKGIETRATGELIVTDSGGKMQFLRRSLLSGAHKFKGSFDQIAPLAFLEEFKRRIITVTELDVIGYGFGDSHINEILERWLNTPHVLLNIYDPHRSLIPPTLSPAADKIRIQNLGLTGYLRCADFSKETLFARGRRQFMEKARERLYQKRLSVWPASSGTSTR